jgi:uncharacterized protein with PQ loop repeat
MSAEALPLLAGSVSTAIFVISYLPMVIKAIRTRDLTSYSHANLLLANLGNAVHSIYVYSLPAGPIWALHSFYAATGAFMYIWYLRFALCAKRGTVLQGSKAAEPIIVTPVRPGGARTSRPALHQVRSE